MFFVLSWNDNIWMCKCLPHTLNLLHDCSQWFTSAIKEKNIEGSEHKKCSEIMQTWRMQGSPPTVQTASRWPRMIATCLGSICTQPLRPNCEDTCGKLKNFLPTCAILLDIRVRKIAFESIYLHPLSNNLRVLPRQHTGAWGSCILPLYMCSISGSFANEFFSLEMSVKTRKFAIICAFNRTRTQSCGHRYIVCTIKFP